MVHWKIENVVWMSEYSMVLGNDLLAWILFSCFSKLKTFLTITSYDHHDSYWWYTSSISDYLFYSSSPFSTSCCCLLLVAGCLLFVVCFLLLVACCLLFVVCCLLLVVCCLLFVVCCLLFVVGCLIHSSFNIKPQAHRIERHFHHAALHDLGYLDPIGVEIFQCFFSGVALLIRFLSKRKIGKLTSAWTVYSNSCVFKRVRSTS